MRINGLIYELPKELKVLLGAFVIVLSIGFYSGLLFIGETTDMQPNGIEEQFLGNETNEDADVMKFKKSDKQMLTLVHNHVLSLSLIFFLLGIILSITQVNIRLKMFLLIEPFASIILTFGGIFFLWKGILWMKYIIVFSGVLMTLTFILSRRTYEGI